MTGATPMHCGCGRVRDFEVIDSYPFGVEFTWEKDGAPHTETLFKASHVAASSIDMPCNGQTSITIIAAQLQEACQMPHT